MSDTTDPVLSALHTKRRELELDHVQLAGRILEINECIALIERGGPRRPGRPRANPALNPVRGNIMEIPDRVPGGMAVAEADLPSLDDVRGILRTPEPPEAA